MVDDVSTLTYIDLVINFVHYMGTMEVASSSLQRVPYLITMSLVSSSSATPSLPLTSTSAPIAASSVPPSLMSAPAIVSSVTPTLMSTSDATHATAPPPVATPHSTEPTTTPSGAPTTPAQDEHCQVEFVGLLSHDKNHVMHTMTTSLSSTIPW
jgi:hypothetical protein